MRRPDNILNLFVAALSWTFNATAAGLFLLLWLTT